MKRPHRDQEGFTLIELMVVVLIIGILVAIALPTFLGARTRAQDSAAKAQLRTSLAGAKAYFTDKGSYDDFEVGTNAEGEETGTIWIHADVAATRGTVTINEASGDVVVLSSGSESGAAFCIYSNEGPGIPLVRGSLDAVGATEAAPICLPPSTW